MKQDSKDAKADRITRVAFSVTSVKSNQYIALMVRALEKEGVRISKIATSDLFLRKVQVVHVHWPEHFLRKLNKFSNLKLLVVFLINLKLARLFKIPIVWTVHNVWPHDSKVGQRTLVWFFLKWTQSVDACIYLSASTRAENEKLHPDIRGKPFAVIPHGHYKSVISCVPTKVSARSELGLELSHVVLSHCGIIRSYKNTLSLIKAFSCLGGAHLRLIIAGKCNDDDLLSKINSAIAADARICFFNRFVSDHEMATITAASDLVVLPYLNVTNSGVALYSLSVGCPVLAPAMGSFLDLHEHLGEWIRLYEGDFTQSSLECAIEWLATSPILPALDLSEFDWEKIARDTVRFYQEINNITGNLTG